MNAQLKAAKVPASYFCSITGQIMIEPVVAADGYTYEREAIQKWLMSHDTSPRTNLKLKNKELTDNHDKRGDILEFLEDHPELYEKDEVYLPKAWIEQLVVAIKGNKMSNVKEWLAKDRRLLTTKLAGNYTAFHLACEFGSVELTNILLENLQKTNQLDKILEKPLNFKPNYLNVLLEQSLEKKDKATFTLLLKLEAELEQPELHTQNTLLHRMIIKGQIEPVSWLLEQGANLESLNAEGNTPLLLAVLYNHTELSEFLLKKKANVNIKNHKQESPLSLALFTQNKSILSLLVGAKKAALPPLHLALELNEIGILKALLEKKDITIEALDEEKRTPFLVAVEKGDIKAVSLLLEKGANPAVMGGTKPLTALHIAIEHNNLAMLKLLLETKAISLIDVPNVNGDTPLHLAAKLGQEDMIPLLLKAGAWHKSKNAQGQTPIELAIKQDHVNLANLIEQTVRAIKRAKSEEMKALQQTVKAQSTQLEQLNKNLQSQQEKIATLEQDKKEYEKLQAKLEQGKKALINQFNHFKNTNKQTPKELLLKTLHGHTGYVYCLQLLPNGELVSGSYDNTIKVWDLKSGNCLKTLQGHTQSVSCLQLLPNGELVNGSFDNTIKVWDLKSGNCLKTLQGHTGYVYCLQLLPNGELVSSSCDNTIKVWDLTEFVLDLDKEFKEQLENCCIM